MILRNLRKFVGNDLKSVQSYLTTELNTFLTKLVVVVGHLTFAENFDSFSFSFSLATGETVTIPNRLGTRDLDWIITRITGDNRLVEGDNWSAKELFLKNMGAVTITATVFFFRR